MEGTGSITPDSPESGYSFGLFRLNPEGKLFRGEVAIELTKAELRALRLLLARAGQVVTLAQLRQAIGRSGKESSEEVSRSIASLERRLGLPGCIQAVYKRGYRFLTDVVPDCEPHVTSAPRLAILPLQPGNGAPEYLGEALAEEAGRRLKADAGRAVQVLEQDSVSTLARRAWSAEQIGAAMKADLVLAGTLQALPGRYRLRAVMMRGADGGELWTEDLVVPEDQVNTLGDELAERVCLRLGATISLAAASESEGLPSREAQELLWHARSEWKSLERHQMQDAMRRLERAVGLAPDWMEARCELVNLCVMQAMYGFMAPLVAANIIRRTAEGVVDRGGEALLPALGWVHLFADRDLGAAQLAFARSAHLHGRWITRIRASFACSLHRFSEAIGMLEECMRLDPYSAGLHARLAWALHLAEAADESVKRIDYALREFPEHGLTKLYAVMILAHNGKAKRAVAVAEELVRKCPYLDPASSAHAYALASAGRIDEARSVLEHLQWLSRERFVLRGFAPAAFVALGEHDAALEELRVSNVSRCPWFFQALADPRLKPLRERAEFGELAGILKRMEGAEA